MTYLSIGAALIILSVAVVFAVKNRNEFSKWVSCVLIGVFFSTFFMVLPTQWVKTGQTVTREKLYTVVSSLMYSFKTVGGRQDIGQLESVSLTGAVKSVYVILNYLCFVAAPVLTSGLILSAVGDLGERLRYGLSFAPEYYIFSEINENAITLAKGIKSKSGRKILLFCGAKGTDKHLLGKVRELGGIALHKSCKDVKLSHRGARYEFCILSEEEGTNIRLTETLIAQKDRLKKRNVIINTFAQSGTNVNLLESLLAKTPCAVVESPRLMNRIKRLINENPKIQVYVYNAQEGTEELETFAKARDVVLVRGSEAPVSGEKRHIFLMDGPWQDAQVDPSFADRDITLYYLAENGTETKEKNKGLQYENGRFSEHWKDDALRIRFVDEIALFCNHLIFENPLYQLPEGRKDISVLLVGGGRLGVQMLKTAVWYGQIQGHTLKIRLLDKNASRIRQELYAQCPELTHYDIAFIDTDVETGDFQDRVLENADATFVCVATGSDELNIAVAEQLYLIFRRQYTGYIPPIFTRVRKRAICQNFNQDSNYLSERNIHIFGTAETIFADNTLFNTRLENLAFAVHLCYNWALDAPKESYAYQKAKNDFFTSEYSRRSSMAAALHISAKLHSCGITADMETLLDDPELAERFKTMLEEDPKLLERLAISEHTRWNAFVRSEGFRTTDMETVRKYAPITRTHKDETAKLHPCILPWEELDTLQKEYDDLQKKLELKPSNFKEYDLKIVAEIPRILQKAKALWEEGI